MLLQETTETKVCTKCKEEKKFADFGSAPHHKDKKKSQCRKCESKWHSENYKKNGKIKERIVAWRKANPEWQKNYQKEYNKRFPMKIREKRLKYTFGIGLEEYNKMFDQQGGRCAICSTHQMELNHTLCIDHNHKTGKVRELLCMKCNQALGSIKEDIKSAKALVEYIRKHNVG